MPAYSIGKETKKRTQSIIKHPLFEKVMYQE